MSKSQDSSEKQKKRLRLKDLRQSISYYHNLLISLLEKNSDTDQVESVASKLQQLLAEEAALKITLENLDKETIISKYKQETQNLFDVLRHFSYAHLLPTKQ